MHVQRSLTAASAGALFLACGASASVLPGTTENKSYNVRRDLKTGLGTRYGKNCQEEDCWQSGACAFTNYELPSTIDGSTCVSEAIWDSSAHCGGCIRVTYKGKTITIMVSRFVAAMCSLAHHTRLRTRLMATPIISTCHLLPGRN